MSNVPQRTPANPEPHLRPGRRVRSGSGSEPRVFSRGGEVRVFGQVMFCFCLLFFLGGGAGGLRVRVPGRECPLVGGGGGGFGLGFRKVRVRLFFWWGSGRVRRGSFLCDLKGGGGGGFGFWFGFGLGSFASFGRGVRVRVPFFPKASRRVLWKKRLPTTQLTYSN